jgi:predicted nucleic acid-binding protein
LNKVPEFATAPVTQMGFLRVGMSAAYGASFSDAQAALGAILKLKSHRFLSDSVAALALPVLASGKDVTDAHLVRLAIGCGFKLATLDEILCKRPWAIGVAENPLW